MLDVKKHRQVMFEAIRDIYGSEWGSFWVLRGNDGLFFDGLDRFSTDLDFDLTDLSMEKRYLKNYQRFYYDREELRRRLTSR